MGLSAVLVSSAGALVINTSGPLTIYYADGAVHTSYVHDGVALVERSDAALLWPLRPPEMYNAEMVELISAGRPELSVPLVHLVYDETYARVLRYMPNARAALQMWSCHVRQMRRAVKGAESDGADGHQLNGDIIDLHIMDADEILDLWDVAGCASTWDVAGCASTCDVAE
jgi:hypothetical protein